MNTNDMFWKLTRGVRFGKKNRYDNSRMDLQYQLPSDPAPPDQVGELPDATELGEHQLTSLTEPSKPAASEQLSSDELRKLSRIRVTGADMARPVASFEELHLRYGVAERLLERLRASGYHEPTPVQQQAIPAMLERRELLVCAPTGSGKTAAYLVPILHSLRQPNRTAGCRALVVAPSRELARQITLEAARLAEGTGLRVHCLDKVKQQSTDGSAQKKSAASKCDLLVTTPNRLIYLLNVESAPLSLRSVQWLVIDESDKLFEAGARGFRDQLGRIYTACDSTQVRRALFSATFAQEVQDWCRLNLDNVLTVSVGQRNAASDVVEQQLVFAGSENGKLYAFRNIMQQGLVTPCLIFVQTKDRAKELFKELIYDGIMVDVIHADRTQAQRDNVVKAFRSGGVWVLICTELMGRGIDFKGVNLVINYDMPPSSVSYIHRIGRTGRAGRPGKAITFFTSEDVPNMRQIAFLVKNSGCEVPDYLLQAPKKSKKQRRELAEHPLKRAGIDTTPLYDQEKKARIKALRKAQERRQGKKMVPSAAEKVKSGKSNKGKKKKENFIRAFETKAFKKASSLKSGKKTKVKGRTKTKTGD